MPESADNQVSPEREGPAYAPLVVLLDTSWIMDLVSPQGQNFGIVSSLFAADKLRRDEIAIQSLGPGIHRAPEDFAAKAKLGSEALTLLVPYHLTRFRKPGLQKPNFGTVAEICDALRGKASYPSRDLDQFLKVLEFAERDFCVEFQVVMPTEVKTEIGRNLKHPQKAGPARNARVVYAEMLQFAFFLEVDLAAVPRVEMSETSLGPDSDTDKALVSYAVHRANEGAYVCVATNDGGILAECASLLAKKHLPIFTPLNWNRLEEIYTQQFEARLEEFESGQQRATKGKGWWFLKAAR